MTSDPGRLIDPRLPPGRALIAEGRALARDWSVGRSAFQRDTGCDSEAAYKRRAMAEGRLMQHAHVGFRDIDKTVSACATIHDRCAAAGARIDRFGVCLDWSMGYPQAMRRGRARGTGIVLDGAEDFARITASAPAAAHFGDFMLGLPGAVENTRAALAAGSTSIGNLGQYFTFRLPHWDDDVATTIATVKALGLIAAQREEVLVHSNLDDGFAALFADMGSSLGMVLIETWLVESLVGARIGHCYGHHFAEPATRMAFQRALAAVTTTPGTMIFGATVSYRTTPAGNFASLASYLLADILGQRRGPTGHAVNPVPVTENQRIPDVDEIVDAQVFAARLAEHAVDWSPLVGPEDRIDAQAARIGDGGRRFKANVLAGLEARGVDLDDPAAVLLALRRLGPKRLEALFGAGEPDAAEPGGRRPIVPSAELQALRRRARVLVATVAPDVVRLIRTASPSVLVATTDVHEHGKLLIEEMLRGLGVSVVDGGVAADADDLAETARDSGADLIAVSTYNGVALSYAEALRRELDRRRVIAPVLFGGRLNQIPDGSNTSLPVEVGDELTRFGVVACPSAEDLFGPLIEVAARRIEAARERADTAL